MRIVLLQLCLCWLILYTRNEFQIIPSRDINQNKQQIIGDDQASVTNLLMCWHFYNVSFIPLYKGIKTRRFAETQQHLNCAKTQLKLLCINHLEFLKKFHILEILES